MTTPPSPGARELVNEITIDAPVEVVWKALSDADELQRWFPLECRVTPGVGGSIWFAWKEMMTGESRIDIWEPNRRLRTSWEMGDPAGSGSPVRLADDYFLTARAGQTVLRLVSSGFGADASWDGMYDCIRRGWNFELRGLTHYLERHRGRDRAVAWVQQKITMPLDQMLDRLMGEGGFRAEPAWRTLRAGDQWRATNADGSPLTGEVLHFDPTGLIAIRLDQWNSALLRIEHEPAAPDGFGGLWLWFSIYGEDPARVAALEEAWKAKCAAMLG